MKMKKKIKIKAFLIAASLLILVSCIPRFYHYQLNYFDLNKKYSIRIGYPITEWEVGSKSKNRRIGINKELIYTGIENNIIRLVYREYYIDSDLIYGVKTARASFFMNLEYDLNQSKTIVFQDLTIKVLKADNREITFEVIQAPKQVFPVEIKNNQDQNISNHPMDFGD